MILKRDTGSNQKLEVSSGTVPSIAGVGVTPQAATTNYLVLGLTVGAIIGGSILLIIVLIFLIKKCGNKKKGLSDYGFDDCTTLTSKSAPSTRSSSPRLPKRNNSLSGQGGVMPNKKSAILMRSLTVDMIPDFELPPERVQPYNKGEKNGSQTALQFQHSILSSLSVDLGASAEADDPDRLPSSSGRLWFSLVYDAAVEELTVNLIKAKQLKPRDKSNTPRDPFVKIYLLPDERACQESRVRKKTLSPKFNETFMFKVPCEEIPTRTLRMSVYDVDKRRVRHSLGHVLVALADTDLTRCDVMWRDLEQLSQNIGSLGEFNVSMSYTPTTEKLKVVVLRARNLRKLEFDDDTGVYVRVQLIHGAKVHKTKRTEILRGTCEPVYNEAFAFTVPTRQVDSCSIIITVMVNVTGRLGSHEEEYGKIVLGPFLYARGEELMHWQETMAQPRNTVTRWHQLTHKKKTDSV